MTKLRTHWVCQSCGRTSPRPMGRCPGCGEWNTMLETPAEPPSQRPRGASAAAGASEPRRLADIEGEGLERLPLPLPEFSRVLGGGVVPGSLILVGGDPGIGKSTLLLQVGGALAQTTGRPVLYVSGEESARQIKMRADRLAIGSDGLYVVAETSLETILRHSDALDPVAVIVDSIQTVYSEELAASAGSLSQVRHTAARFQGWAKGGGAAVFLVGHVTKQGAIAGPKVLEHIVDTVLYLEGDSFHAYRLLRSVKNRFGATSEVGVFEMREGGMAEVPNPSEVFLAERVVNAPGSAIAVTLEGTRPLLVEVQALASGTSFGNPRRTANGVDFNRLLLITAVLTRRVGLRLFDQDIFANVVGGLQVEEPAADLAVAVAIASSVRDRPVAADLALVGEVGLSGEVRAVSQTAVRLREAAGLGFRRCLVPKSLQRRPDAPPEGIEAIAVRSVAEAVEKALV
jgi:DNA repair protein RadA/Sms